MPIFHAPKLIRLVEQLFTAAGVPAEDAGIVAHSLVDANLCGHDSHGVLRVPQYIDLVRKGTYNVGVPITILSETPALIVADGNWGLGQVQAYRLLARMMAKAREVGIAAGTLKNCGHTGRLGEYAEAAAREKMAFFGAVNSHGSGQRVAPPGGKQGRISTNPICMGAPTSTDPVVLDFGTSAAAEGKVRSQFQKKEKTPPGWLIDSEGQPTTDPSVLYKEPLGSLLPFGGTQAYKGFGLGLIIDLFCGGLSGGNCTNPTFSLAGRGNALVFVVFDTAKFAGSEHFIHESDGLTEYVRSCPRAEGVAAITLPGDPERITKKQREVEGISIPDGTWELIAQTAKELGVELPG